MPLKARWDSVESRSRFRSLIEHDLFGKPPHTFPDHALAPAGPRAAGHSVQFRLTLSFLLLDQICLDIERPIARLQLASAGVRYAQLIRPSRKIADNLRSGFVLLRIVRQVQNLNPPVAEDCNDRRRAQWRRYDIFESARFGRRIRDHQFLSRFDEIGRRFRGLRNHFRTGKYLGHSPPSIDINQQNIAGLFCRDSKRHFRTDVDRLLRDHLQREACRVWNAGQGAASSRRALCNPHHPCLRSERSRC
jgi:hypothetical protein